ncbi:MAG: sodium:calcium symporter [Coraliomargarita sp.]
MESLLKEIETIAGLWTPLLLVGIFLASSLLIVWRLELMTRRGVQGTVLGTLFMPYFSGLGNLIFVAVLLRQNGPGEAIAVNCWTNNITNLCLLLALPALIWGLKLESSSRSKKALRESQLSRLSLALTLVAMVFFSLTVWVLGQDGSVDRLDGFALVGLFLFWQCFHIFEVLKENTRTGSTWSPMIILDVALIMVGSFCTLLSVEGVVEMIMRSERGFFNTDQLGLLTGWLMVLPNAVLAFYYAWRQQGDIVYSSQVGDGHICIPLCIGMFAIFQPIHMPELFSQGLLVIAALAAAHLICVLIFRGLPKWASVLFLGAYGATLYLQLST